MTEWYIGDDQSLTANALVVLAVLLLPIVALYTQMLFHRVGVWIKLVRDPPPRYIESRRGSHDR